MSMAEAGAMRYRGFEERIARELIVTASERVCPRCGETLWVTQHRERFVETLGGVVHWVRCDKRCPDEVCPGRARIYRPPEDLRIAFPRKIFGLDVVRFVGEEHILRGQSLSAIGRDLVARGVPIDQTHVGDLFRDFVALRKLSRGEDDDVKEKLRAQGGVVLMADGVQFDERSPVLYVAWDALSATPLFGEWRQFKGVDDLASVLRRVKAMDVPVIAVVSDKETGLVPAVAEVFPGVPQQLCQFHFLENCSAAMKPELASLAESVATRAEKARKIAKRLHEKGVDWTASTATETDLTDISELCEITRASSRASGKAPLEPPELTRHNRLEVVRQTVEELRREGGLQGHRKDGRSSSRQAR